MPESAFMRIFYLPLPEHETEWWPSQFYREKQNSLGGMVRFCIDGTPSTARRWRFADIYHPAGCICNLESPHESSWTTGSHRTECAHHRHTAAGNHSELHQATPSACRELTFCVTSRNLASLHTDIFGKLNTSKGRTRTSYRSAILLMDSRGN